MKYSRIIKIITVLISILITVGYRPTNFKEHLIRSSRTLLLNCAFQTFQRRQLSRVSFIFNVPPQEKSINDRSKKRARSFIGFLAGPHQDMPLPRNDITQVLHSIETKVRHFHRRPPECVIK